MKGENRKMRALLGMGSQTYGQAVLSIQEVGRAEKKGYSECQVARGQEELVLSQNFY